MRGPRQCGAVGKKDLTSIWSHQIHIARISSRLSRTNKNQIIWLDLDNEELKLSLTGEWQQHSQWLIVIVVIAVSSVCCSISNPQLRPKFNEIFALCVRVLVCAAKTNTNTLHLPTLMWMISHYYSAYSLIVFKKRRSKCDGRMCLHCTKNRINHHEYRQWIFRSCKCCLMQRRTHTRKPAFLLCVKNRFSRVYYQHATACSSPYERYW